jgi:histidinol-phosphate phosphatase family protein
MSMILQAVYLVGGKGTRLGHLTQDTPKPLLEIAPRLRFLDVVLEEAARHGFTDILLLAGHLGEQVEAAYQGKRIYEATVSVVREPEPQGTGGALRFAADRLAPAFLMGNGDSLFEINLRALAAGLGADAAARLALRRVDNPDRYGSVVLEGRRIVRFLEKSPDIKGPAPINGGLYVMRREIVDLIEGPCSLEQDVFPKLAAQGRLEAALFEGYFLDMGLPDTYAQAKAETPARRRRPCAFLDRDGVLNVEVGYAHRPDQLAWMPGSLEAVRLLNEAGYYVIVVTNQAGVARGYYPLEQIRVFHAAMAEGLAAEGAHVDAWYACPFHEDGVVPAFTVPNHPDRKPNPGMLNRAMADWPVMRDGSFLIGDKTTDIEAADAAGIPGYLYRGGDLRDLVRHALLKAQAAGSP